MVDSGRPLRFYQQGRCEIRPTVEIVALVATIGVPASLGFSAPWSAAGVRSSPATLGLGSATAKRGGGRAGVDLGRGRGSNLA